MFNTVIINTNAFTKQWNSTTGNPYTVVGDDRPQTGEEFAAELTKVQVRRPAPVVNTAALNHKLNGQFWAHPSYARVAARV